MFKTAAACEKAFYDAFVNADLKAMADVWGDTDDVRCVHPRGVILMGHERVMSSWKRIFDTGERMSLALVDRGWMEEGKVAVHTLEEHIGIKGEGSQGKTICTNIFHRGDDGGWELVVHHASPLPRPKRKVETDEKSERPTLH